ncbi:MAG: HepT-like ribonuclease domain-containing protein [Bacteroidota bacterium]
MSDKDRGNLLAILDSSSKIKKFVEDHENADSFHEDIETFDAVLLNFVIIGESVARLSEEVKEENSHIPWRQIKGFRNFVVHDYFGVDAEEVWEIIKIHLPEFEGNIQQLIIKTP